jgi:hypothetical protein
MKDKLSKLVSELEALVPPEVIQKKTGGFLWPPRPEMPGQEVPDYAAQLKQNMANAGKIGDIQAAARTTWLREGVLDYVKATQDPALWDLETGKLRPQVKDEIMARLDGGLAELAFDPDLIDGISIIGSMVGRQYRSNSDIDIEILVNEGVPDELVQSAVTHMATKVSGQPIKGTRHPVNFYITKTQPPIDTIEGRYDLLDDSWIKKSTASPENVDPEKEYADIYKSARLVSDEIVLLFSELRRDVQDLLELRALDSEFADDLQLQKLQEVNETMMCLTRISKVLWRAQDDVFKAGKGDPRHSPQNILYKFVDKSGELKTLHKIGNVRNQYVDGLAKALNVEAENA